VNIEGIKLMLRQSKVLRLLLSPALALRRQGARGRESVQNEMLDNLARLLGDDAIMTVREFRGSFAIGTRSDLFRVIVKTGGYEPELSRICACHVPADRDVIDVGANIGLYTVLFAKMLHGRKVLSIEPTPNALARLRRNIQLNGVQNKVTVFGGAASDRHGEAQINTVAGREEYSSLGSLSHPNIAGVHHEVIRVPSATIDSLALEHGLDPGFVKIDVEGMEHVVLGGMTEVLKTSRPVILSELSDPLLKRNGSSSREVIQFIEGFGYRVTDPLNERLRPGQRAYGDILCVPVGRGAEKAG